MTPNFQGDATADAAMRHIARINANTVFRKKRLFILNSPFPDSGVYHLSCKPFRTRPPSFEPVTPSPQIVDFACSLKQEPTPGCEIDEADDHVWNFCLASVASQ
jgi:hypothetical protein